jgi:anti-sigma-K factor RskA
MATEACRDWRGDLGIEALGRLEEPERTALRSHLDGCPDCRGALAELSAVASALDLADASRVGETDVPDPSRELGERILGRLQWERAAVHRRRLRRGVFAAVATAAVAAVVAVVLALAIGASGGQHGTVVALRSPDRSVHAQAVLFAENSGTRVQLRVDGLDDREWYWLWLTGPDGKRVAAGTFSASSAGEDVTMTGALSLARTRWVTDSSDRVVLDGYLASS